MLVGVEFGSLGCLGSSVEGIAIPALSDAQMHTITGWPAADIARPEVLLRAIHLQYMYGLIMYGTDLLYGVQLRGRWRALINSCGRFFIIAMLYMFMGAPQVLGLVKAHAIGLWEKAWRGEECQA